MKFNTKNPWLIIILGVFLVAITSFTAFKIGQKTIAHQFKAQEPNIVTPEPISDTPTTQEVQTTSPQNTQEMTQTQPDLVVYYDNPIGSGKITFSQNPVNVVLGQKLMLNPAREKMGLTYDLGNLSHYFDLPGIQTGDSYVVGTANKIGQTTLHMFMIHNAPLNADLKINIMDIKDLPNSSRDNQSINDEFLRQSQKEAEKMKSSSNSPSNNSTNSYSNNLQETNWMDKISGTWKTVNEEGVESTFVVTLNKNKTLDPQQNIYFLAIDRNKTSKYDIDSCSFFQVDYINNLSRTLSVHNENRFSYSLVMSADLSKFDVYSKGKIIRTWKRSL